MKMKNYLCSPKTAVVQVKTLLSLVLLFVLASCNPDAWLAGKYAGSYFKYTDNDQARTVRLILYEDGTGRMGTRKLTWSRPSQFILTISPADSPQIWEFKIITQIRRQGTFLWQTNGGMFFWKTYSSSPDDLKKVMSVGLLEEVRRRVEGESP